MVKVTKRILSGIVALATVMVPALLLPSIDICLFLVAIATLSILEFYRLLELTGTRAFPCLGAFFGAALVVATWARLTLDFSINLDAEPVLLAALAMAVFIRLFPQKNNGQPLSTAAGTVLGFVYVSVLFNYFTKLAFEWDQVGWLGLAGTTGRMLFFYLLAVVKLSDIGAYIVGTHWGRHKLIPRISPAKTWEGCAGGLVFGLAGSMIFFLLSGGQLGQLTMNVRDAILLGLLLPLVGVAGDLSESTLKRASGSKDSGSVAPGLGGILDILDSLLFAVPVLYYYAVYVLSPTA